MGLPPGLTRLRRENPPTSARPESATVIKNSDGYDGPNDGYDNSNSGYDGPRGNDRSGDRYDGPEAGYDGPDSAHSAIKPPVPVRR